MKNVVYLLGAGVNQTMTDWEGFSPPLAKNLFYVFLKKKKYRYFLETEDLKDVFEYIEKYWKKNVEDLSSSNFDIEQCFTFIDSQIKDAEKQGNKEHSEKLLNISFQLKAILALVLSDFEIQSLRSTSMRNFGKTIMHEQPIILTFNYDCIVESALEHTYGSSLTFPPEETFHSPSKDYHFEKIKATLNEMKYCDYNWNRALAYGIEFDEIELRKSLTKYARGLEYYSLEEHKLYSKPILKLHGSLNWFKYLPYRSSPFFYESPEPVLGEKKTELILINKQWWSLVHIPSYDGWYIDPVIITPTLYKEEYYKEKPFNIIWEKAKKALEDCDKLVIIGYSFSPTDFATRKLLLEAFVENDLKELVIVNPNVSLLETVRELTHYKKAVVWCKNLNEYINLFSKEVELEKEIIIKEEDLPTDTSPHDAFVNCKTCGIEFRVGMRTNPRSHATNYINLKTNCPNGHVHSYEKTDFILKQITEDM